MNIVCEDVPHEEIPGYRHHRGRYLKDETLAILDRLDMVPSAHSLQIIVAPIEKMPGLLMRLRYVLPKYRPGWTVRQSDHTILVEPAGCEEMRALG